MAQFKILIGVDRAGVTLTGEIVTESVSGAILPIISRSQTRTLAVDGIDAWEYILGDAGGAVVSPANVYVGATTSDGQGFMFGLWGNLNGLQASGTVSSFTVQLTAETPPNQMPVFVSVPAVTYTEGQPDLQIYTALATDANGDELTYSLANTPDSQFFNIDTYGGGLFWVNAPSAASPQDANADNVYELTISASDGFGAATINVSVTVQAAAVDSDAQAVIDTNAVSQMLGGELTIDSLAAIVSSLAVAADASDVANKAELQGQISTLETSVAAALAAADRLESYEKGQIEELIQQLVTSPNFMSLLGTATVTLGGKVLTVESVLKLIAEAPKVANWKKVEDTAGNMSGVIATLTSGGVVTFGMAVTAIDADTNKHIFTVQDFAGSGIAKSFYLVMKAKVINFTGLFGGRLTNQRVGWTLEEQSNIVFDIVGTATSANSSSFTVPDFNADGALGNAA